MVDSALNQLGVDLDRVDTSAQYDQGTEVNTRNGKAVYVRAASAIAQFDFVVYAPASAAASTSVDAFPASTGNVGGKSFAVAQTSIASGSFGWVHTALHKEGRVKTAAACQPNVQLYTTGTGGVLDDATVSAGVIVGIEVLTSAASASAPPCKASNIALVRNAAIN